MGMCSDRRVWRYARPEGGLGSSGESLCVIRAHAPEAGLFVATDYRAKANGVNARSVPIGLSFQYVIFFRYCFRLPEFHFPSSYRGLWSGPFGCPFTIAATFPPENERNLAEECLINTKFREKLHSLLRLCHKVQSWRLRRLGSGIPLDRQQKTCDGWSIWIYFGG